MLKIKFIPVLLLFCTFGFAQVGINSTNPVATLDIVASQVNGTTAEGVIPPRLTGEQIKSANSFYNSAQRGAIVYATAAITSADVSGKTTAITIPGLYCFNGTIWQYIQQTTGAALFLAQLGSGAGAQVNATIAATGFNTILLPNVTKNLGGGVWNATNNTYQVPFSGTYLIKSSIRLTDLATSRSIFQAVHTSNIDIADGIWQTNPTGQRRFTMLYNRIAFFNAGDLLRLYIYSDGSTADLSDASLNIILLSQN